MFLICALAVVAALKAPKHGSPGQRPGTRDPQQVPALKGRHKIALTHNVRPMAQGSFSYALSGLDNKSRPPHKPGRCPGLSCSGLSARSLESPGGSSFHAIIGSLANLQEKHKLAKHGQMCRFRTRSWCKSMTSSGRAEAVQRLERAQVHAAVQEHLRGIDARGQVVGGQQFALTASLEDVALAGLVEQVDAIADQHR